MRLRLAIELVPALLQHANLRRAVRQATWDRLRHDVYRAAGLRCQACGASGRLSCHERWQYDDKTGVARLKGFRALCNACHAVCHPGGFSARMRERGELHLVFGEGDLGPLDPKTGFTPGAHWCKVNGLDRAAWNRHLKAAKARDEKHNQRSWRVDLGKWADLVPAERRRGRWLLPKDQWSRRRRSPGSERFRDYWLRAKAPPGRQPGRTDWVGVWFAFASAEDVGAAWRKIKRATEAGRLGIEAKMVTRRPNPLDTSGSRRIILVYTYNGKDEADMERVYEEFRRLGFAYRRPRKTGEDPAAGGFRTTGPRRWVRYHG